MKVEKVNFNLHNAQNYDVPQKYNGTSRLAVSGNTPSFSGRYTQKDIYKELMKYMSPQIKVMLKFKEWMGEAQNIIINSVGTGLVAPIFIKYNPLSKTDEDTRTYSAWRQPVSAVLAIATQLGATIPFNNKVASMANQGKLGQDYNMTPFMEEKYLTKLAKKQHPNATPAEIKELVVAMEKDQHDALIKDLKTKNTVMFIEDGQPNKVPMSKARFKETLEATVENLIKSETTEKTRSDKTKRKLRIQRSDYYRTHADVANKHMDSLNEIFKSGHIDDVRKNLLTKINEMKANKADKELIKFTQEIFEIGDKATNDKVIGQMVEKVERAKGYIQDYSAMTSKEQVIERVNKSIAGRVTDVDKTLKFFEKVKQAVAEDKTVHEITTMFTKECKQNKRLEELSIDFAEQVAEQLAKQTKACLKGYKQVGGIFVSLATLFVSCPLLNWVYPRFMAAVFPNLSNGKHQKDTTDLIEQANNSTQANQKVEVK